MLIFIKNRNAKINIKNRKNVSLQQNSYRFNYVPCGQFYRKTG